MPVCPKCNLEMARICNEVSEIFPKQLLEVFECKKCGFEVRHTYVVSRR